MRKKQVLLFSLLFALSQNSKAQKVSLRGKNLSLIEIFHSIKKQTGFDFIFTTAQIDNANPISVDIQNIDIKEALKICLKNQPFKAEIKKNLISLIDATTEKQHTPPPSKQTTEEIVANPLFQGIVYDADGNALSNVNVTMKSENKFDVTDNFGHFKIPSTGNNREEELTFSYVGMKTATVKLESSHYNYIKLVNDTSELNSIVITGYQDLKRSDFAGSASYIKASDLNINGFNTLEQALQGKIAGVVVQNQSGLLGVRQKTRVRGTSTLMGSQEPVWVVDGILQEDPIPFKTSVFNSVGDATSDNFDYLRNYVGNSISWLNPMDIEDITVLKDASATAIYGVRAANGVIVIRTKKGQVGKPTVSYSFGLNLSQRVNYRKLGMMNSKDRIAVSREIFDRGLTSTFMNTNIGYFNALKNYLNKDITEDEFNAQVKAMEMTNTDWFDILFQNPVSTNNVISIGGGSQDARFYASFGYNNSQGTAIGNKTNAYTANFSTTLQLSKKLNVQARLSASQNVNNGFYNGVDPYTYASKMNRILPAYNTDGSPYQYIVSDGYRFNIINERNNSGNQNRTQTVNMNVGVNYDILPGLKYTSLFGYNASAVFGEAYASENTHYIAVNYRKYDYGTAKANSIKYKGSQLPIGGEYDAMQSNKSVLNWRNSFSLVKTINQVHNFTIMAGTEISSTKYKGYNSTQFGYLPDRGKTFATIPITYGTANTANPLIRDNASRSITDSRINNMGIFASGNYSYDNKYVANFSVRGDASNRFGQFKSEKFNPVWAGGFRWNISQEKFFEKSYWLTNLSLRSTWGYQRNIVSNVSPDLIVKFPSGSTSSSVDAFTGDNLLTISSLPYGDLRWERNLSINYGLDLGLLDNLLQLTVEYYTKKGRDLINWKTVPLELGVVSMPINGSSMNNSGYEITASVTPIKKTNTTFSIAINTSKNYNKIVSTGTQNLSWRTAASGSYSKQGYPVTGFWAFDFKGIDPATGYPIIDLTTKAGSDPTNDPTSYMKYVGKLTPDFTSGLNLMFRYKQLTFMSSIYLQVGGKKFLSPLYNNVSAGAIYLPQEYDNLTTQLLQRWTPSNTTASIPGLPDKSVPTVTLPNKTTAGSSTITNVYEMYNYSTARVVDATQLQINNLNASYTLRSTLISKLHIKNANIGLGATNLLMINSRKFKGIDSEVATGGQPRTRAYNVNLNFSF